MSATIKLMLKILRKSVYGTHKAQEVKILEMIVKFREKKTEIC